ncbi:MAG: hypothetical protein R3234_08880, partial [Thermoanaerobaculia bacterium]|nr:hypothetical protein [Thermoanaerobaculia bacterium]
MHRTTRQPTAEDTPDESSPDSPPPDPGSRSGTRFWPTVRHLLKRPFYWAYERRLLAEMSDWKLPGHIGIIMDGNRRFARSQGRRHASFGHRRG